MSSRRRRRSGRAERGGLRNRVAGFVLVAFVPLGLLAYAATASSHRAITGEARARVEEGAVLQARITEVRFSVLADTVAALASGPVFTQATLDAQDDPDAVAQVQPYLDSYRAAVPGSSHAAVLDPAGRLLAISPHSDELIGQDFSYRDWYRGVVKTGRPYVSEAFRTAAPGKPLVVGVAAPIPDPSGGRAAGYLILGYRLDSIQQFSARFARERGVSLTLTDQRGVILSSPQQRPGLVSAASDEPVQRALAGETGVLDVDDDAGGKIVGFAPIASLGWTAHAGLPRDEVLKGFAGARATVFAMSGLLSVVLVLGLLGMVRVWRARDRAEGELVRREADLGEAEVVGRLGSWRYDLSSGEEFWSPGLHRLLNVQPDDAPLTRSTFFERLPDDAAIELAHAEATTIATGEPFVVDHRLLDEGEGIRWFSTRGEVVRSADEGVTGVRGVSIDITYRKSMEEKVVKAQEELATLASALESTNVELRRSNLDLEQFAYSASHDLAEPLRAISGPVSLLARRYRGQLDETADQYIDFAIDGCARMQTIIDDMLVYSRVGRADAAPLGQVDCDGVLRGLLRTLAPQIAEKGARVETSSLPRACAESGQLEQVFQNLLTNALKFTAPGVTPSIEVSWEPAGDFVRISVTDNGIGIAPAHREQVFEMFKRLHTRAEYPGTGIGLALCKRIVERFGGTIGIDDGPGGVGSRVWFTLRRGEEASP